MIEEDSWKGTPSILEASKERNLLVGMHQGFVGSVEESALDTYHSFDLVNGESNYLGLFCRDKDGRKPNFEWVL